MGRRGIAGGARSVSSLVARRWRWGGDCPGATMLVRRSHLCRFGATLV